MTAALHADAGRRPMVGANRLVVAGTVLVALPLLAGAAMAVVMLSGRVEDPSNWFGALWGAALFASPVGIAGAVCLAIGLRHDLPVQHTVLAVTVFALAGAAGGVLLPPLSGLDDESTLSRGLTFVLEGVTGGFVLLYAVCLLALTVIGLRRLTREGPSLPRHAVRS